MIADESVNTWDAHNNPHGDGDGGDEPPPWDPDEENYPPWDDHEPVHLDPDTGTGRNPATGDGGTGAGEELAPPATPDWRRRLYPVPDDPSTTRPPKPVAGQHPSNPPEPGIPLGNTDEELFGEVFTQLERLTATVTDLADIVNAKDEEPGTGPGTHHRYRYERHPPAKAAAAQTELAAWVRWLVGSYQLTDLIPPCWARHDPLAEELAGFYVAWQTVWADRGRYDGGILWHEQLGKALDGRFTSWLRGARCGPSCALDTDFAEQALHRWDQQTADTGGNEHRITRTRRFAPPVHTPQPRPRKAARQQQPPRPGSAAPTRKGGSTR